MENLELKSMSVSEIVNRYPGAVEVFEKFKIDYCCHSKLNFAKACQKANVDEVFIRKELKYAVAEIPATSTNAHEWPLDLLANYIVQNHHLYVRKAIPGIVVLANKVKIIHDRRHPELAEIKKQFGILKDELEKHMYNEETILFPSIINLVSQNFGDHPDAGRIIGFRLMDSIGLMEEEHESAGQCLTKIRMTSNGFIIPSDGCNSFRLLYQRLEEFEEDLHTHIHLENNILFPKALMLEAKLVGDLACLF